MVLVVLAGAMFGKWADSNGSKEETECQGEDNNDVHENI